MSSAKMSENCRLQNSCYIVQVCVQVLIWLGAVMHAAAISVRVS